MTRRGCLILALVSVWLAGPSTAAGQAGRVAVLVRHAEAAAEPRQDPPLTDRGRARAEALAVALADAEVSAVIVSSLARTGLTAQPLALARGITPLVADVAGGIEEHIQAVADAVRARPAGETVLVIGHSNTIPAVITALGGPSMPDLCHGEFSRLFVLLVPDAGTPLLIRTLYGEPDPDDACAN